MVKYMILGLLAFLLFLLLAPVKADLLWRKETLSLRLWLLWVLPIRLLPGKPEEERKKKPQKAGKKKPPPEKKKAKKPAPGGPVEQALDILRMVNDLLPQVGRFLGRMLRGITLSRCRVLLVVSGEEAAEVGIAAGRAYALAYGAYGVLRQFIRVKEFTFNVLPDYLSGKGAADAEVTLQARPITLLAGGMVLLFHLAKTILAGRGQKISTS